MKKVRDGFIVTMLFVSVCLCWFLSSEVLAGDGGFAGTYVRVDGKQRLVINSDQTYELTWLENESVNRGLYEDIECWLKDEEDPKKGNVMFYTADGDKCCVSLRKL
jgi:hypothetical protein